MIRRILVLGFALAFVSVGAVQADDVGGEDVNVPPPVVAVEETVIIEEAVTAPPPPYVSLESTSVAAGIGLSWGEGVLTFEGVRHTFSVKGLSLLDVGVATIFSEGAVENLASLEDFEGNYIAIGAGAAAGVGAGVVTMRNDHGVVIRLKADAKGLALAMGPEGLRIALD
jgi:hypothetical protein